MADRNIAPVDPDRAVEAARCAVVVMLGFAWVPLRRLLLCNLPLGLRATRLPPAIQMA